MFYKIQKRFDDDGTLENYGIAVAKQEIGEGFGDDWVDGAEGFDVGDWYSV